MWGTIKQASICIKGVSGWEKGIEKNFEIVMAENLSSLM